MFITREITRHTLHTKELRCTYASCWNTVKTRWHSPENDLECRQVQAKVCVRCINRVSMFITREITRHTLHTKEPRCTYASCWNTVKTQRHSLNNLECRQVKAKVCVTRSFSFIKCRWKDTQYTPRNQGVPMLVAKTQLKHSGTVLTESRMSLNAIKVLCHSIVRQSYS
jgi:hypothetical protein